MKKIFNIAILMASLMVIPACHYEIDDVFDQPSAIRIQEEIAKVNDILKSAENGWLMEFYGAATYGGYNVFCKFNEDNTVLAQSELYGPATVTSHYKLEQSQGVVLSFDEYNKIIHFFSDPSNPLGWGSDGDGMEGDFEFRVMEANSDMVVLSGKKHGATIIMKPMAEDVTWNDYLAKVYAIEETMSAAAYIITSGDKSVQASSLYRQFSYFDAESGKTVNIPYIITDKGYNLYNGFTFNGNDISEFLYSVEDDKCYSDEAKTVSLEVKVVPISEAILSGEWFFEVAESSASVIAAYEAANAASEVILGPIDGTFLGSMEYFTGTPDPWGLVCVVAGYPGSLHLTPTIIDEDTITLTASGGSDSYGNGAIFYAHCGFDGVIATLEGTFDLTTDNLKNPTWIKMQDTVNPDNYSMLYK